MGLHPLELYGVMNDGQEVGNMEFGCKVLFVNRGRPDLHFWLIAKVDDRRVVQAKDKVVTATTVWYLRKQFQKLNHST